MLLRYAREHHFPNPTFFVDDGVSGVTYDHPGFQAMLAEIEAGRVAVCISKDLSRLGRNSALTGLYTNFTFPQLQRVFCFLASQHRQYAVISSWSGWRLACGFNVRNVAQSANALASVLGVRIRQHQQKRQPKFYTLPRAKASRFPEKFSEKRLEMPWVKVQVHQICQSPFWHLFVTPLKMGAKKPGSR